MLTKLVIPAISVIKKYIGIQTFTSNQIVHKQIRQLSFDKGMMLFLTLLGAGGVGWSFGPESWGPLF